MRLLKRLTFFAFAFLTTNLLAQTTIENDNLKFWQPEIKLIPQDFKADTSKAFNNLNRKFGVKAFPSIVLKSILDVPKKKRERGKKLEKIFLVPCVEKFRSISITEDSLEMAKQQLLFDITELYARKARKEFKYLEDSLGHVYGIYWSMYSTVIGNICVEKNEMIDAYMNEVILFPKDGAYEKWKKQIEFHLSETKEFATKPEDCLRFLNQKPLTDDYIMSPNYAGEIKCKK